MWLKTYLTFSKERPLWAFLVDDLLANHVPKECRPKLLKLRVNPFMQKWKPKSRGLPAELQGLMKVARKYGVRMEGLAFSKDIQSAIPMWDHIYADQKRLGRLTCPSKLLTCLQSVHNAVTVGDFLRIAESPDPNTHRPRANCKCVRCKTMREVTGCKNPRLCMARAKDILDTLPGKWDPRRRQPQDYEDEVMADLNQEGLSEGLRPFDRRVTTYGDAGHTFRIFTDAGPVSNACTPMEITENGEAVTAATDGSCINNGERNAIAGAGVYVAENHSSNTSLRLPTHLDQSNQTGEITATLLA
ncbi:hypothetical protein K466DRAFT_613128, partial [Polyporus arcularius HHB13444]